MPVGPADGEQIPSAPALPQDLTGGLQQHVGWDTHSQVPGWDAQSQVPGWDAQSQVPGWDAQSQVPGWDAQSQVPGWDAHSQVPGWDAQSQVPGWDAHSQVPGWDAHSQDPGWDTHSQDQGWDTYSPVPVDDPGHEWFVPGPTQQVTNPFLGPPGSLEPAAGFDPSWEFQPAPPPSQPPTLDRAGGEPTDWSGAAPEGTTSNALAWGEPVHQGSGPHPGALLPTMPPPEMPLRESALPLPESVRPVLEIARPTAARAIPENALPAVAGVHQPDRPSHSVPPTRPFPVRVLAAVLIALIALAGVVLFSFNQVRTPAASTATAVAEHLARPAPPGWSVTYAWSADLPEITGQVAVGQNSVAFIDRSGALDVRSADTGLPVFTSAPNTVSGSARPFIAVTQGVPVAGIVDGANLMLWSLDAGSSEAQQITLALNARVFQQGGGLMVSTGKEHWIVTSSFTLSPVTLPADHVALGVTPEGTFLSAPPSGSWSINSLDSRAPAEVVRPERAPEGTQGEMQVAWASRGVICAWGNTADPDQRTVALYDAATGRMLASHVLAKAVVQNGLPLTVSPNREFASAGPMLARLADGQVDVVDGWSTIMAGQRSLYGTVDGVKMTWDGSRAVPLDPRAVVPWGTSERGYAIVMEQIGGNQVRLGGLRPA